jgi:hypothetical protein
MGEEHVWPFHGGGQLSTASLRANWLGEMTVHGYDVASAAGLDWSVRDQDAQDLLVFLRQIVPTYARPGDSVAVAVAPDDGPAWTIRIGPESVMTADGAEDVQATVSGAAWPLALLLYQRTPLQGLSVSGDSGAVERLFAAVERP